MLVFFIENLEWSVKVNKILLIIPAYNEQDSILSTTQTIDEYNKNHSHPLDYIVINDGSKDNTLIELIKIKEINMDAAAIKIAIKL